MVGQQALSFTVLRLWGREGLTRHTLQQALSFVERYPVFKCYSFIGRLHCTWSWDSRQCPHFKKLLYSMSPFVEMFCSEFSQSPVFTLFASCAPHVLCARYDGEVVNEYQLSEATHIISEAPVVRSTCEVGFLCPCVCACAVVMMCM